MSVFLFAANSNAANIYNNVLHSSNLEKSGVEYNFQSNISCNHSSLVACNRFVETGAVIVHKGHRKFWSDPATQLGITIFSNLVPITRLATWLASGARIVLGTVAVKEGIQFMKYQGNFVLKSGWKNWSNYMNKRGWNFDDIQQTLLKGKWNPHSGTNYINYGNSMSIVTNPKTGKSLIIDNITKEIIHLGEKGYVY
jgi:hypothetical protein